MPRPERHIVASLTYIQTSAAAKTSIYMVLHVCDGLARLINIDECVAKGPAGWETTCNVDKLSSERWRREIFQSRRMYKPSSQRSLPGSLSIRINTVYGANAEYVFVRGVEWFYNQTSSRTVGISTIFTPSGRVCSC